MRTVQKVIYHLSAGLFGLILILLGAAVFWRYALNDSIIWAEEAIRFIFIWMFFLSMPEVSRRGGHLALDLLPTSLRGRPKQVLEILIELLNIAFLAVLLYYSVRMAWLNMSQRSPALLIPYGAIYFALTVGSALMILATCQRIHRIAAGIAPDQPAQEGIE